MTHPNRSRRKANERRRAEAAAKQKPIPVAGQQIRAANNAAAATKRYPDAPRYDKQPTAKAQPIAPKYRGCGSLLRLLPMGGLFARRKAA